MKSLYLAEQKGAVQEPEENLGSRRLSLLALNSALGSNTVNYWEIYGPARFHHFTESPSVAAHSDCKLSLPHPKSAAVWSHQWDPPLSRPESEGIPSLCVPNPKPFCKPRLWSMQLHAHVDTLTRKHWFKHTQMHTNVRIRYMKSPGAIDHWEQVENLACTHRL